VEHLYVTEEQIKLQLTIWNQTYSPYPLDKILTQLFEEQVAKTPNNVAIKFEEEQLTYTELNKKSNQLARYLKTKGVQTETFVTVALTRSIELIISILAILKVGGTYVPLDFSQPKDRLSYILEDTKASFIITQSCLIESLPPLQKIQCFIFDELGESLTNESKNNLPISTSPDNLVYVLYTSGTTGKPKGSMAIQRGIVNRLWWTIQNYNLNANDTILHISPIGFDIAFWEQLVLLLCGGLVIITKNGSEKDPNNLWRNIKEQKVTILHAVPALLSNMLEEFDSSFSIHLRLLLCGGDVVPPGLIKRCQFLFPKIKIHHSYGPTETSICVTDWDCNNKVQGKSLPIGKPIANCLLYVLNEKLQLLPIGMVGELYIGGVAVSRGYLNQPQLTKEKFIDNPFAEGRLYRTGDLVRYLPDGNVEFLGRNDSQVKIHGRRIELSEIEYALNQHPEIKQSIVILYKKEQIIAYIVKKQLTFNLDSLHLREYLAQLLPDYMLPQAYIMLDYFPLSSNGKIDKHALPRPGQHSDERVTTVYVGPRNEEEEALTLLIAEILQLPTDFIGINDDFFSIGGDSINAIQICSKARKKKLLFSIEDVFDCRTIAKMATKIQVNAAIFIDQEKELLNECINNSNTTLNYLVNNINQEILFNTIAKYGETGQVISCYPLSPLQEGLLYTALKDPNSDRYLAQNIYELTGKLDINALHLAWQKVVDHQDILRTGFIWEEISQPLQFIIKEKTVNWEIYDWSNMPDEQEKQLLRKYLICDRTNTFDLHQSHLIRVRLIQWKDTNRHTLIWTLHHIISDGWSIALILKNIWQTYEQIMKNEMTNLQDNPRYEKYINWLYHQDKLIAAAYWKSYLSDTEANQINFKMGIYTRRTIMPSLKFIMRLKLN
jgi:amino acid adenylation domain-containing protein